MGNTNTTVYSFGCGNEIHVTKMCLHPGVNC